MTVICCSGSIPPCEQDQKEIQDLIIFKEKLKKMLDKSKEKWYNNYRNRERQVLTYEITFNFYHLKCTECYHSDSKINRHY